MISDFRSRTIIISMFLLFILALVPGVPGHSDWEFWRNWAIFNANNGLDKVYTGDTDYLPGYQYVLYVYGKMQGTDAAIELHIRYLKFFTVIFDVIGIWFVHKWTKRPDFIFLFFACFFNPGFSYNSIIWGQIDAIPSALMFAAFYFIWNKKIALSTVFMILSLSFKLQVIIFVPLLGLLYLNFLAVEKNWKAFFIGIISAAIAGLIILLPFITTPESRQGLINVVFNSVGKFDKVSWFAYNFWCLFVKDPIQIPDKQIFFAGLSYKNIGLILFCSLSFCAMLPIIRIVVYNIINKQKRLINVERLWLTGALIPLLFFYVNTEMHERYSHPAFLFIIAYSFFRRDFFPLIIMSIAYFLNLEEIFRWLRLNSYGTLIFQPAFIASLYLVLIVYLFFRLYTAKGISTEA